MAATTTPFEVAPMTTATTIAGAFRFTVDRVPDRTALRMRGSDDGLTWAQLRDRVDELAGGLHALGLRRGDTIALMIGNRPEFHICDLAAMTLGAIPFSIYQTSSPEQIEYFLQGLRRPDRDRRADPRGALPGGRGQRRHVRATDRHRRRDARGRDRTRGGVRRLPRRLRRRGALARRRARRPADADLHVGHHRSAEGRDAHPREPDRRELGPQRAGRSCPTAGASSRGCRRRTSPNAAPTTTCRSSSG